MQTRRLDIRDDAACRRAYDVLVAAKSLHRPWNLPPSFEESLVEWRHVDAAEPMEMWAAVGGDGGVGGDAVGDGDDPGVVVGIATLWLPRDDNTTQMWCDVAVDPAHQRRGAGTALVSRLVERAAAEGRTRLVTDFTVPVGADESHPYRRFAASNGFTLATTEITRHLHLPVADALLDGLMDKAGSAYRGAYRVETHVNGVPEPLRASLCSVMNLLGVDAPSGELEFEAETLTPVRYADYLEVEARQHRTRLTAVAVHEASGDVVAFSDLILPAGAPTRVWQWGTMVARGHRGHRLGTAVKVANLRRLQRDHPGRTLVVTANEETNAFMVDINVALGFEVVELCPGYQRRLA